MPNLALLLLLTLAAAAEDATLWQLGTADDSAAEFAALGGAADPVVEIDARAPRRDACPTVPAGIRGSAERSLTVRFSLPTVPRHGALLAMKLLDAPTSGAQMAVFVGRRCAGLVQLWGTSGGHSPYPWRKTYRLMIPRELLRAGRNELRLAAVRPLWGDASADDRIWWTWDFLRLDALAAPATEPVHGSTTWLGTTLKHGSQGFQVDDATLALAPIAFRWLGIAFSGNTVRADFWYDVAPQQPRRVEYLRLLRDLNLTALVDHIGGGHFRLEGGQVPERIEQDLRRFLSDCGGLAQWYELGNEPCMFGGGLEETVALAALVNRIKPPHLKTLAPAWAYGGGKGDPLNWDADVGNRKRIEALCDAINGHSYGFSYADDRGGSFVEELAGCGGVVDGWPKEYVNSETGANAWHADDNGPKLPSTQTHAQAFDRILRAHVAVVERTMQHAAIFDDNGLFSPVPADHPEQLAAWPPVGSETATHLQTFRRLACAYATHGAPLAWTVVDGDATLDRLVYVRAVDTATLPPAPGSGATSDKVLVNLVNFEATPASIRVRVVLPRAGVWSGDRIGAGATWMAARADASVRAAPAAEFSADLAAGETVQWILSPPR